MCNIGDCLMRWTNDVYVSTPHRVVSPPGRERYSIAFFLDPNPDTVVAVLPSCRGPGGSERYAPIVAADFCARASIRPTREPAAELDRSDAIGQEIGSAPAVRSADTPANDG